MAGDKKQQEVVTIDQVKILIAGAGDELKGLLVEALKGLLTEERVLLLIDEKFAEVKPLLDEHLQAVFTENQDKTRELISESQEKIIDYCTTLQPGITATLGETEPVKPPFDPAWLTGLFYSGASQKKELVDGRPRLVPKTYRRPLTPADVLGYAVTDDTVTITTADGRKHLVEI